MKEAKWILLDEKPSTVLINGIPSPGEIVEITSKGSIVTGTAFRIGTEAESKDSFKAPAIGADVIYSAEI